MSRRHAPPSPSRLRALLAFAAMICASAIGFGAEEAIPSASAGPSRIWTVVALGDGQEIRLYRPHAETLAGDQLTARAAFCLERPDDTAAAPTPRFGVVWFEARAAIDREERTVALSAQRVTRVLLPDADEQQRSEISRAIAAALQARAPVLKLDRLLTSLQRAEQERDAAEQLDRTPPAILVRETPSVLVTLDGEPQGEPLPGTAFERIVNTPFMLARDTRGGAFWLYYGGRWYTAPAIDRAWRAVEAVPEQITALLPQLTGFDVTSAPEPIGPALQVVVSEAPAELIDLDGPPKLVEVPGTRLRAVANADRQVFLDEQWRHYFALLSGRWFHTADLARGPWIYVGARELPEDFARIPADSPYADVRAHVGGTTEADEAMLDAELPQTAVVKRDAAVEVAYDGDPEWQPLPGTHEFYAVNTPDAVIKVREDLFYCCHQGVWYTAPIHRGPWVVATQAPPEIDLIPPSCPIYQVRFVYVYESTAEWVYVGYTPGYCGSYVYDGSVVWGTGYRYRPWWRQHFYARPCTWGLAMSYNPFTCAWGSDVHAACGGSTGWWAFGIAGANGRWWGPMGYRPAYVRHRDADDRDRFIARERLSANARERLESPPSVDIYHHPGNAARVVVIERPGPMEEHRAPATPARPAPEHVYPTGSGEVYRKDGDTWQRWDGANWRNAPTAPTAHEQPHAPPATPEEKHPPSPARPAIPPAPEKPKITPPTPPHLAPTLRERTPEPASDRVEDLEQQRRADERGAERVQHLDSFRSAPPRQATVVEPQPRQAQPAAPDGRNRDR